MVQNSIINQNNCSPGKKTEEVTLVTTMRMSMWVYLARIQPQIQQQFLPTTATTLILFYQDKLCQFLFIFVYFLSNVITFSHLKISLIYSCNCIVYTPNCTQSTTTQLIMPHENTSLKNVVPAGGFNTSDKMFVGLTNSYQRSFLLLLVSY